MEMKIFALVLVVLVVVAVAVEANGDGGISGKNLIFGRSEFSQMLILLTQFHEYQREHKYLLKDGGNHAHKNCFVPVTDG